MEPTRGADHRSAVAAATLAAGALIAQQVAGKATRDALFLTHYPVAALPVAMVASAIVSAAAVLAFSSALTRRSPARILPRVLAVGTMLLLAEWGLSLVQPRLAAVAVYLHMAAFGATVVSGFWSLVSERFDPYTARRVMGRVGLGASLGGVGGGLLAWSAARILPVSSMLAVMAALNVAGLLALGWMGASPRGLTASGRSLEAEPGPLHGLRLLREVPYLRDLGIVVALGAITETLLDYVVSARAVATFGRGEPLMAFFALFHTAVGLLALALQTTVARAALRSLGLAGTVALRPGAAALGALAALVDPRLWSAVAARGAHGVLNNSLFRSGYELLFTPLPGRRKRPTKTIIDVGFDKLGSIAAGLIALLMAAPAASGHRALLAVAAGSAVAAVAVSRRLHRGYVAALEESLRSGVIRLDAVDVVDSATLLTMARTGVVDGQEAAALLELAARRRERPEELRDDVGDPVPRVVADLRSKDGEAIRRALHREDVMDVAMVGHLVPLLPRNDVFLDVLRVLRRLAPRATGQLVDALLDPGQDVAVRRRIARVLRGCPTPRAVVGLLAALRDSHFEVRREVALTLARLTEREPGLVVPRDVAFAAALAELVEGTSGWTADTEPAAADASPGARPQSPAERGLTHVFTLLSLALDRQPLQTALVALLSGDPVLRGTALEYLATVLPDDLRRALWPHVGAGRPPAATPEGGAPRDAPTPRGS
jgi:ATP:ADP antiporter, AAA family